MRLWIFTGILFTLLLDLSAGYPAGEEHGSSELLAITLKLPDCALNCLYTSASKSKCNLNDLSDLTCICTDDVFLNAAESCTLANCTTEQTLTATRIQKDACGFPKRDESNVTRGVAWAFFGVAIIFVGLRFLGNTTHLGGKGYGWDDWSILLCLAGLFPLTIILNFTLDWGLGRDIWTLRPRNITNVLFYFVLQEFVYTTIVLLTKISILLMYLRLFPHTEAWFRHSCIGAIILIAITAIPGYLTTVFQCDPINYAWLRWNSKHSGTCINTVAQITAFAGVNIVLDLMVFLLPIPRLVKLNVSRSKKVAVMMVFMFGLFVTICSAIRIQYLFIWGTSTNPTWQYNELALWSAIECDLGVVCACLPPLAGPSKRLWKKIKKIYYDRASSTRTSSLFRRRGESQMLQSNSNRMFAAQPISKPFSKAAFNPHRYDSSDEHELVERNPDTDIRIVQETTWKIEDNT